MTTIRKGDSDSPHQSLDTGAEFPPHPAPMAPESSQAQTADAANYARTIAAVLLVFLRSLPESVVPLSLHQRCAESTSRDEALEVRHNRDASEMSWLNNAHDT